MAPQRFREQFTQIQRSMPDVPLAVGPDDAGEFLYEKGVVLARDGEEARVVEDTVRRHFTTFAGLTPEQVRRAGPETNRSGITRIRVADPGQGDGSGDPAVAGALRALSAAEGRTGRRLVSRNHVVSIAVNACPGDEPVPASRAAGPNPAAAEGVHDPGSAVAVLVIDTGLMRDHRSYPPLAHTRGDAQVAECDGDGVLQQYCGHGTFIAGLVAAVAPNTDITVRGTLNDAGAVLESEFGEKLFEAVDRDGWPDVISLSAGTSNGRTDGLLGVDAFMRELRDRHTLLVAAAGNNGSATPFWPAAYADLPGYENAVLSVGALRADGESGACFSNHGGWVKAYAPGERLTGALTGFETPVPYVYQHSTYDACRYGFTYPCTCHHPRHTGVLSEDGVSAKPDQVMFEGLAQWSGTSFATPVAVGMVAAHMTARAETDPREARRQLLRANTEFAEVRGAHVPALLPPTWRPVRVSPPSARA
ncbi:S8/S53 family peptidase [Streptomyces fungicidicus]|uniref:S8/S53 family peptidase n=1 Tax=Streptomyces fungicidicus TaxID=68203 RepID=UPI003682A783